MEHTENLNLFLSIVEETLSLCYDDASLSSVFLRYMFVFQCLTLPAAHQYINHPDSLFLYLTLGSNVDNIKYLGRVLCNSRATTPPRGRPGSRVTLVVLRCSREGSFRESPILTSWDPVSVSEGSLKGLNVKENIDCVLHLQDLIIKSLYLDCTCHEFYPMRL